MNRSLRKAQARQLQIVSNTGRLRRRLLIHTWAPHALSVYLSDSSSEYEAQHMRTLRHRYKDE